ncbi:MAG: hypothetical protein CL912_14365 [Deltaproteobacteria bacterium]|nr:hypothetical protein [Deltaproteobacteria bacterium]
MEAKASVQGPSREQDWEQLPTGSLTLLYPRDLPPVDILPGGETCISPPRRVTLDFDQAASRQPHFLLRLGF